MLSRPDRHIILYRPLEPRADFSAGVRAECAHRDALQDWGQKYTDPRRPTRPIIFLHSKSDAGRVLLSPF